MVLNFYAKIVNADNKASNGIYHVINHPLIPPPSLFDDLYIATDFFSTLTQATYGLHGQEYTDYHYDRDASKPGHPKFKGTPLATLFAPTNAAFHALPGPLKFFLFSPFGEHALAKTLAYHYIPDTLLLSELLVDQRKHKHSEGEAEVEYFALGDDPSFHKEFDIHPKLPNSTLHIVVDKTKVLPVEGAVKTTIKVNDQITLAVDVQARNGAFHVSQPKVQRPFVADCSRWASSWSRPTTIMTSTAWTSPTSTPGRTGRSGFRPLLPSRCPFRMPRGLLRDDGSSVICTIQRSRMNAKSPSIAPVPCPREDQLSVSSLIVTVRCHRQCHPHHHRHRSMRAAVGRCCPPHAPTKYRLAHFLTIGPDGVL